MIKFCYYWGYAGIPWNQGDWTWADCEIIEEICSTWGDTGVWWNNANWWWSMCSGSIPPVPPVPVASASLQSLGVDATTVVQPWLIEPWNPYTAAGENDKKRKRLIKLICKVKGTTYEEEKQAGTTNTISVDDIKMVVKAISNIDLDVNVKNL